MNALRTALILSIAILAFAAPQAASAQALSIGVGININTAPPPLPVYEQPPCPTAGYLWTPGYWAYASDGYYWVPGVWVSPPQPRVLWTPGYWGLGGGFYAWHPGYWGAHVGYYGGLNYGFGYTGVGFYGGRWAGGAFSYNTAYANVNTTVVNNTYVRNVTVNTTNVDTNHYSFNGAGGATMQPTQRQLAVENQQHFDATPEQLSHQQVAGTDRSQFASVNHGAPGTTAMNSVNGRRFDQQGRIAQGVGSGSLTPGETKNLENREDNLNSTVRADRSANGGTLTPAEHQQVDDRQNNIGNSIYDDKHNAAAQHDGTGEVGTRKYDQQQRISNGISSGQMTPHEAANTERREQNINRSLRADRSANGGRLTAAQHNRVNQRQNRVSHQIYRQKHNGSVAPK